MHTFRQKLKTWDKKLDKCLPLVLILSLVAILRIPNFFEPYWYGDEAIYLAVGNGLNQGKVLYRDIMDHKTPIIYYLARVPNQLWFRILLLLWSFSIIGFFYFFAQKLIKNKYLFWLATLSVALLTTLPWLEGNIPNGELFVLGFIMAGFWLVGKTSLMDFAFKETGLTSNKHQASFFARLKTHLKVTAKEHWKLGLGGMFFGLGLMTKVPALFDFAALLSLIFIGWIKPIKFRGFNLKQLSKRLPEAVSYGLVLTVGFLLPTLISIVYFYFKGALPDYIHYGLLYNFHYAGTWHHDFGSFLLNFIFTLKGKVLFLGLLTTLIFIFKNKLTPKLQFVLFWTGLALVASLLSNRPYPHYFIQLTVPVSLLVFVTLDQLLKSAKLTTSKKLINLGFSLGLILTTLAAFVILNFKPYSTTSYYLKFLKLATGQIDKTTYDESFNYLVKDNNQVAKIIGNTPNKEIFIWGTNPMLYALTKTTPPTQFVVLFHIEDVNAYDEVYEDLTKNPPRFIVQMKDASQMPAEFRTFTGKYYLPNYQFDHLVLWRKIHN